MLRLVITSIILLMIAALLASGIMFVHKRLLTYLAAAGMLFQGAWLLLTLIARTVLVQVDAQLVFLIGSIIALAVSVAYIKHWSWPYGTPGGGVRDLVILPLFMIAFASAALVGSGNGFRGHEWVTHGFYNGDTATFAALVRRSLDTPGLVVTNPFAGNGYLEYPTLLHGAVASFMQQTQAGSSVLHFLPIMTYVQILLTVPLFFLLWDVVLPAPKNAADHWLGLRRRSHVYIAQAGITLYIMALSWDNYVYPQSHFFLTGLVLLLTALLAKAYFLRGRAEFVHTSLAAAVALVLLFSNAVMGTVAVVLFGVFALLHTMNARRLPNERGTYLLVALAAGAAFLTVGSGDPVFGIPSLSYTAAGDMLRLSLAIGFLLLGAWQHISRHQFIAVASIVLASLAFFTFFTSTRNIIVDNASRFFYHALLVGFPFLLGVCVQAFYFLRRELLYTSRAVAERLALWVSAAVAILLFLLPGGASFVSAHDHLLYQDEQVVTTAMRSALWWIEDETAPQSIFLASPYPPFSIPLFTGRSLLRTDYWLSPDDRVQADVVAAFAGDKAAQEQVATQADYLLLTQSQRATWEPLPEHVTRVFDTGGVVIYQLR